MAHGTEDPPPQDGQRSPLDTTKASLDRIKKQLTSSGRFLLQGSLLKRSETLRKWNQRWCTLDPTTGKLEYRLQRGDIVPKGLINFDANSTITVSPINFHGLQKYDGCCIYIETLAKKEYFLCAETPGAARAWVSTLQAAQLVLKAHKEAVNALGGRGYSKLGTVAAVVAAANATAKEAAKEITVSMQASTMTALKSNTSQGNDGFMDDLSIMKETLRVKDEELHQMAKEMRARDGTIKDMAERLSETAEAAEAAASAAHIMDKERKAVRTEIAKLRRELDERLHSSALELKAAEEKLVATEKSRDEALQEAHTWRFELAKAREHAVVMEGAVVRAEESARIAIADAEMKIQTFLEREAAFISAKGSAEKEINILHSQLKRNVENGLHQPSTVRDIEKHITTPYSPEVIKPSEMGGNVSLGQEGTSVTPTVASSVDLGTDSQLVDLETVENSSGNDSDATGGTAVQPPAEVQKHRVQDSFSSKQDNELDDLTEEDCNQDVSVDDTHLNSN